MTVVVDPITISTADVLRVIELSPGGRPIELLNLENGATYRKERDSFQITPPPRKARVVQYSSRYGGQRTVGETHENGAVGATWRVNGGSANAALANVEDLLEQVESAARAHFLEWRPSGATQPTLFEIRGPGSYAPKYRWVEFAQIQAIGFDISWPVAPLVRYLPMDIYDDFSVDSIADYTFDAGVSTDVAVSGGSLTPAGTLTSERRMIHTARGYSHAEAQATLKFTPGATLTSFKAGRALRRVDASNYVEVYVDDNGTNSRLRIDVIQGGTRTNRASVNLAARIANGTAGWCRGRIEGQTVYAEHFTSQPTPMGTPANSTSYTLSGGEQTAIPSGPLGLSWIPQHASALLDDYEDLPFTYRNQTLPAKISLGGSVPGSAPALVDLDVTPSGGTNPPVFALISPTQRPGTPLAAHAVPFGILEAESAADLAGWASGADASSRGGNRLNDATPTSAEAYTASWAVDPSTLVPEEFSEADILIEVWARVILSSSLVSPRLTLSARPSAGTSFGAERFTLEYGTAGKVLTVPSSGTVYRMVRLGTLNLRSDADRPIGSKLWLAGSLGTGSGGTIWGLDYLLIALAKARALNPSGKANDSSYPKFVETTSETRRLVRSDLAGFAAQPPGNLFPDTGLGGSELELPPGQADVLVKLSSLAPDDPTVDATSEQLSHAATVHAAVTPRAQLARAG